MTTKCQMTDCDWSGKLEEQFYDHFETAHKSYIRHKTNDDVFEFNFLELYDKKPETHLLLHGEEMYWLKPKIDKESVHYKIYSIGDTQDETYFIKLGGFAESTWHQICGPYETKNINDINTEYDLEIPYQTIFLLYEEKPKIRIYFTENVEDVDGETCIGLSPNDLNWEQPKNEELNHKLIEIFTCSICRNYIQSEAIRCERYHYVCSSCYTILNENTKSTKKMCAFCPLCKGDYLIDARCNKVEALLKVLKFPSDDDKNGIFINEGYKQYPDDMDVIEMSLDIPENEVMKFLLSTDGKDIEVIEIEIEDVTEMFNLETICRNLFTSEEREKMRFGF